MSDNLAFFFSFAQVILQSETIQELTKTSQALASLQEEASELRKLADALKTENVRHALYFLTHGSNFNNTQTEVGLLMFQHIFVSFKL